MPNVTSIGEKGFYYCNALKEVYMPKVETIGNNAFENCTALKNIDFPDTLKEIGNSAFSGAALEKVIFPDSLESIGGAAFANCKNLKTISYGKNINKVGVNAFQNDNKVKVIDASAITTLKDKDYWDASLAYGYIFGSKDVKEANTTFTVSHDFIAYLDKASYAGLLKSKFGPDAYYAVTNGGTFADDTEFTERTLATPIKSGFMFLGWYDNAACTGEAVTAPRAGNVYYANWKAKAEQELSYNAETIEKHVGDAAFTNALSETTVHGDVTYTSDNEKVATVDATTGEVTIVGAGTATITATAAETGDYKEASAHYELTVTKHEFKDSWESDADNHWHSCAVEGCTVKSDEAPHDFEWIVDKNATAAEKGTKHQECTVCHFQKDPVEIPAKGTSGGDQNANGSGTNADTSTNGTKTGDTMPIGMLAVLMLAAGAGIVFCGRKLYKSR